jgi:ribosomal protein S18 acetylase RimI-like enzyme
MRRFNNPWMHVRTATRKDLDDICLLDHACYGDLYNGRKLLRDALRDRTQSVVVWVDCGADVYGFGRVDCCGPIAFIDVCVRPENRRQGIGSQLLQRCLTMELPSRIESVQSTVMGVNLDGQLFLREFGWRSIGSHELDGHDVIVFEWDGSTYPLQKRREQQRQ